jgi:tetratricopeptide (TPR) repeat protein
VPLDEQPFLQTQLSIYTRRPEVSKAIGARVYLIVGLGKPRRYFLWESFRLEHIKREGDEICAWGTGRQMQPPIRLQGRDFQIFHRDCGWFIGFRGIDDLPYHKQLADLVAQNESAIFDDRVERFCSELLELLDENGDGWFYRGFVRLRLGRLPEARNDLERAIQKQSEHAATAQALLQQCE